MQNLRTRGGHKAPNQYVEFKGEDTYFISYSSVCAKFNRVTKLLTLGLNWDYSQTTMRYLAQFINEYTDFRYISPAHTRSMIKGGCYVYDENMRSLDILN